MREVGTNQVQLHFGYPLGLLLMITAAKRKKNACPRVVPCRHYDENERICMGHAISWAMWMNYGAHTDIEVVENNRRKDSEFCGDLQNRSVLLSWIDITAERSEQKS